MDIKNVETKLFNENAKKTPVLLIIGICFLFLLSSCAISNSFSIGDSKYLNLWCIEVLNDNEVLAAYAEEDYNVVVKIITNGKSYSRLQRIQGYFTCVDYWTYETIEGNINTVPVIVKTSEYEK